MYTVPNYLLLLPLPFLLSAVPFPLEEDGAAILPWPIGAGVVEVQLLSDQFHARVCHVRSSVRGGVCLHSLGFHWLLSQLSPTALEVKGGASLHC